MNYTLFKEMYWRIPSHQFDEVKSTYKKCMEQGLYKDLIAPGPVWWFLLERMMVAFAFALICANLMPTQSKTCMGCPGSLRP